MPLSNPVQTRLLGTVHIEAHRILDFPRGIPGFEHCRQWHLFHEEKENPLVFWLQALEDTDVMLNVINPSTLQVDYTLSLTETELFELGSEPHHTLAALLILSRSGPDQQIKAMTHAPIIINLDTQKGLQKFGVKCHSMGSSTQKEDMSTALPS
jgi:flagellar assembly factor FliW